MANAPSVEILRLRTTLRDLVALSAIPAAWVGREPSTIAAGLADVLVGSLDLDFAFVRLCDPNGDAAVEVTRGNAWKEFPEWRERHLAAGQLSCKEAIPDVGGGEGTCCGIVIPIGINAEGGLVAVACEHPDFPTEIDQLLLSVASNHAATAFQNSRLIQERRNAEQALRESEQRLRLIRDELEVKVAERTAELQRREAFLAEAQRLSHTGSFGWNPATDEHFWSEETFRIWEYDVSTKITLQLVLDRIHPEDIPHAQHIIARAAGDGQDFDLEYRLLMPGGSVKHIHVVAHAVGAHSGNIEFIGAVMDITERKKTQEALNAAKARFEGILEIAEDAIISVDSGQNIVLFNQGAEKVFGYGQAEVIGKRLDILLPQRFVHSHRGHIEGFAKSPDVSRSMAQRREVFGRRKDGSEFPAEASISKLTLGSDVVFTVILRDITDRKRVEEALRKSEQQWKDVFENNPTMYFMLRADGTILSVNPFGAEQLGYTVKELVGSPILNICHEPDRVADKEKIAECLGQLGRAMNWEFRKVRKDGGVLWVRKTARAVLRDNQPIVLVACEDITDRKQAEEAVRRSETLLAEGQRISHTGSWVWKPATGEVTSSTERFRIFGMDPDTTKPSFDVFLERIHPDDQAKFKQIVDVALREKRDFEHEYRIVTPAGLIKQIHSVGHAVVNEAGELVEFIGTTMDITERKRAEEALQEARAELARVARVTMMGELAASIAHEVNQPLAGVVTSANAGLNWLAKNPPNLPKVREAVERILRDGTRSGEVLSRIRTLLKRAPLTKSRVSVNQIVRDAVALAEGELRQKNIELSVELNTSLPAILGDNIQLQQVLLNLIMNAIEAMAGLSNRRKILLIQSELGDLDGKPAVSVKVSDTGIGLSATDAGRLFEAFHTTKPEGMGMGLWISRSIIDGHGGRLTAQSNDGPGATFQLLLPAETGGSE